MAVPKRGHSQAKFDFHSPNTDPRSEHWKDHTNSKSHPTPKFRQTEKPPKPRTIMADVITPVSKSGTLQTGKFPQKSKSR